MDHARWRETVAASVSFCWQTTSASYRRLSQSWLKEAREAREGARRTLLAGTDPTRAQREAKTATEVARANIFSVIAAELIEKKRLEGKSPRTLKKLGWLSEFAGPAIGDRPIGEISAREVLDVLNGVAARGRYETALKLREFIGGVFRFAVQTSRAENDPTGALRGALVTPTVKPRSAIVAPKAFGGLLRAIEDYKGALETRAALELLALTFVRPGELRAAEWVEFDLDTSVWEIPAGRMKMRKAHRVPLAPRVLAVLKEVRKLTGQGRFLFPSIRSVARCMSENTLNAALRRMGFKNEDMTSHGFRASASSMLNESGLWNADAIERQLAHVDGDSARRAYARAEFWDERVRMMTWWAGRCDELRRGGQVISLAAAV